MASTCIHKAIRILHQDIKINDESKLIRDEIRQLISKNRKILIIIEPGNEVETNDQSNKEITWEYLKIKPGNLIMTS